MSTGRRAGLAASGVGAVALAVALWAGVSAAVSGGGYQPGQQDCYPNSSAWSTPAGQTDQGCHNVAVNVESGGTSQGDASPGNTRYVEWGNNQVPIDRNSKGIPFILSLGEPGYSGSPHSGCLAANTAGTGGGTGTGCGSNASGIGFSSQYDYYALYCPIVLALGSPCEDTNTPVNTFAPATGGAVDYQDIVANGLLVYFGMDDNTDNGEHDGVSGVNGPCPDNPSTTCHSAGSVVGPSDGGGTTLSLTPQNAGNTPTATNPEGLLNLSIGFCADGICAEGTTQQQTVYHGCGTNASTPCTGQGARQTSNDVYHNDTPASTTEPRNCSSGGGGSESCGNGGLDQYRSGTPTNMNAEPGIQTYQDPDPQRSPIFYMPGTYVGTCGVYVNQTGTTGVDPGQVGPNPGGC
ncbi:MAG TPA: hypothetical protein VMV14_10475 [Acidimicrobiales bacterium]|nr:hypothetical protein [Acidimicrobiales bacterium]